MVDVDTQYITLQIHGGSWLNMASFQFKFPLGHNILFMISFHPLSRGFEPATVIQSLMFVMRKQSHFSRVSQCLINNCVNLFIYLGFYVAFNTVQVISRRVVGRAEETSTYSLLGFCTVNC